MAPRTLAVLAVLLACAGAGVAQTTEHMGLWIPLYVTPSPEYKKLIASVETDKCLTDSFHGTVLTGPRNGPPNPANSDEDALYRQYFDVVANTKQWTAFGYVTTLYMKRPIAQVLADIDTWLTPGSKGYGDQVQGIWVDNVVNKFNDDARKYYDTVTSYIKNYNKLVALNPGSNVVDCDFIKGRADFLNNFENYYSVWQKGEPSCANECPCKDVTRCIASIHQYPADATADDMAATMATMSAKGYRAMFITDRVMPNHYSALPTFWPSVITAACTTTLNANSGSKCTPAGTSQAQSNTPAAVSPSPKSGGDKPDSSPKPEDQSSDSTKASPSPKTGDSGSGDSKASPSPKTGDGSNDNKSSPFTQVTTGGDGGGDSKSSPSPDGQDSNSSPKPDGQDTKSSPKPEAQDSPKPEVQDAKSSPKPDGQDTKSSPKPEDSPSPDSKGRRLLRMRTAA